MNDDKKTFGLNLKICSVLLNIYTASGDCAAGRGPGHLGTNHDTPRGSVRRERDSCHLFRDQFVVGLKAGLVRRALQEQIRAPLS